MAPATAFHSGADGKPARYRYTAPMAADDGLRVLPPGSGTLPCDAAAASLSP